MLSRPARTPRAIVARIYRANLAGSFGYVNERFPRGANRREASIAIAPGYVYQGHVPVADMGCAPVRIIRTLRFR